MNQEKECLESEDTRKLIDDEFPLCIRNKCLDEREEIKKRVIT